MALKDRFLAHVGTGRRKVVEIDDVFVLEAVGRKTRIRMGKARALIDLRAIGDLAPILDGHGFLRVHRNHAVNLRRILEIRRREHGSDWEIRMEPPVNRVLPISRDLIADLWAAYGDSE